MCQQTLVETTDTTTDAGTVATLEVCNRSKKCFVPVNLSASEDLKIFVMMMMNRCFETLTPEQTIDGVMMMVMMMMILNLNYIIVPVR